MLGLRCLYVSHDRTCVCARSLIFRNARRFRYKLSRNREHGRVSTAEAADRAPPTRFVCEIGPRTWRRGVTHIRMIAIVASIVRSAEKKRANGCNFENNFQFVAVLRAYIEIEIYVNDCTGKDRSQLVYSLTARL